VVLLGWSSNASAGMLAKGARFPDWKLSDQAGKERSSAELAGKPYLLWFYPRASTPGCTAEGRAFRDAYAEISTAGLVVLGVSFDAPAANAEFAAAEEFPFPLLSDSERKLATAVGAASAPDQWYARRISYLVGPDGTVLVAYDDVEPKGHAAQVLADFRAR
jgi:peroxiredoxin Q/BCP